MSREATLCPPLPQGEGRGEGIQASGIPPGLRNKVSPQHKPHREATLCPPLPLGEGRGEGIQASGIPPGLRNKVSPQHKPHREATLCPPLPLGEGRGEGRRPLGPAATTLGTSCPPLPLGEGWGEGRRPFGSAAITLGTSCPPLLYALQGALGEGVQDVGWGKCFSRTPTRHPFCTTRPSVVQLVGRVGVRCAYPNLLHHEDRFSRGPGRHIPYRAATP